MSIGETTENVAAEAAAEGAGVVAKAGGKWLIGSLIGGVGVCTVVIMASAGPPKSKAPSISGGVVAEEVVDANSPGGGAGQRRTSSMSSPASYTPGSGSAEDRLAAQEMNILSLRNDIIEMQNTQAQVFNDLLQKMDDVHKKAAAAGDVPRITPVVDLPPLMRSARPHERYTSEYQSKVSHFKGNRGNGWAMADGEVKNLVERNSVPQIVTLHQDGSGGWLQSGDVKSVLPDASDVTSISVRQYDYVIPAGSRIIAVTEQPVNSDHPGFFTSRIVRPEVLRGAHLICQQGGQQNNRIPVQVVKVMFRDAEYSLSGQIEMGFPGVTGKVNRHYFSRAVPVVANAAITGGFIAWSANNRGGDRIDTRDMITAEVVGQTLPQIQNEVARFGVERPATVTVPGGTQFSILLTDKLTVRY